MTGFQEVGRGGDPLGDGISRPRGDTAASGSAWISRIRSRLSGTGDGTAGHERGSDPASDSDVVRCSSGWSSRTRTRKSDSRSCRAGGSLTSRATPSVSGSGPAMTSSRSARPRAVRAIGPTTARSRSVGRAGVVGGTVPRLAASPSVGLCAWTPQKCAGTPQKCAGVRNEPARSEPMESTPNPDARAAADPPEDPPGVRPWSHGLSVVPWISLKLCTSCSPKGTFVLPSITAPAALSRDTCTASSAGRWFRWRDMPQLVGSPAMLYDSLTVTGTPSSGRSSPRARAWSASRAAARARSKSGTQIALIASSSRSIRAIASSVSSAEATSPARMAAVSMSADCRFHCLDRDRTDVCGRPRNALSGKGDGLPRPSRPATSTRLRELPRTSEHDSRHFDGPVMQAAALSHTAAGQVNTPFRTTRMITHPIRLPGESFRWGNLRMHRP